MSPPSMILLEEHVEGVVFSVRASPGSRRNGITGQHDGALKVSVTQAPEKGKANKAIIEVLAKSLGLKRSQLELLSGETASHKKFVAREISAAELSERIERVLAELA